MSVNSMMYGLERYALAWGQAGAFRDAFSELYQPMMRERGARLVGAWEATSLSRAWPAAHLLWEFDGPGHIQDVSLGLYQGQKPPIREWEARTTGIVEHAVGRLLHPSEKTPSLAALEAAGVDTTVVVYEEIDTVPDRQVQYCEHIEDVWLPSADQLGRIWIGTYHTQWKNREAISIWALKDPNRPFPGGEMMEQQVFDTPGVRQWNRSAQSVRVGYDDGILVSLGGRA